jgi:hypothetical protein
MTTTTVALVLQLADRMRRAHSQALVGRPAHQSALSTPSVRDTSVPQLRRR